MLAQGGLRRRPKARVMNLKPYLQLDMTKPTAAKHAKMALRMLRPWQGAGEDPMRLEDDVALAQFEDFARDPNAPRWLRKRFEHHNRERRRASARASASASVPPAAGLDLRGDSRQGAGDAPACASASASASAKVEAVRGHGLQWDRDSNTSPWTVRESLQHSKTKPRLACVKEMLRALGAVDGPLPRTSALSVEALVLHILWVDLQGYTKQGKGVVKRCLPRLRLWEAAQAWMDYHKSDLHDKERKELQQCTA